MSIFLIFALAVDLFLGFWMFPDGRSTGDDGFFRIVPGHRRIWRNTFQDNQKREH